MSGGEEPVLRYTYRLANTWANQQLHHTPEGFTLQLLPDGVATRDRAALFNVTAFFAYWSLAQTLYIQVDYFCRNADPANEFEPIFLDGLPFFGDGMTIDESRQALADARSSAQG